jgi:hypothetical protein
MKLIDCIKHYHTTENFSLLWSMDHVRCIFFKFLLAVLSILDVNCLYEFVVLLLAHLVGLYSYVKYQDVSRLSSF